MLIVNVKMPPLYQVFDSEYVKEKSMRKLQKAESNEQGNTGSIDEENEPAHQCGGNIYRGSYPANHPVYREETSIILIDNSRELKDDRTQ